MPLRALVIHEKDDVANLIGPGQRGDQVECDIAGKGKESLELHQLFGYGGGAKSVFPGICDAAGVLRSHSGMLSPSTGPARLQGNPARAGRVRQGVVERLADGRKAS